ncbi:MAG: cytochrome c [Ramlibacter sp.]
MKLASLLLAALLAAPALSAFAADQKAAAPASAAAPAPAPAATAASAKPDLTQGSAKFTAVCAACHGADGNSGIPANPKIAQQHPEYIVKQLQEFKAGKRPGTVMPALAAQLTDADMKNIAWWVGGQKAKSGFAKDKELVALGERIYRGGIAERQVAACAGCHSPNGAGVPSQYPRLSGQHADYTTAQLTGFREGARKNSPQMAQIAARMNDKEIRAVADYIAGLR